MVSVSEIFLGFCRYYNSLNIAYQESIPTNTMRIISYLDNLGRMLGYRIFSELTFKKLFSYMNLKCPSDLVRKKPDMCWGKIVDEKMEYELILESEQEMNEEKIENALNKLIIFPSNVKILYCAHDEPKEVLKILQKLYNKRKKVLGTLLLIIDPWTTPNKFSEGSLIGLLINSDLEITHTGSAEVFKYSDGIVDIRLFKNSVWVSITE